jgi:hypothetical protein
MENKKSEDNLKHINIRRAGIFIFTVIAVLSILALTLFGLLLGFPWQLILGMALGVPFMMGFAWLGFKHGLKMYK